MKRTRREWQEVKRQWARANANRPKKLQRVPLTPDEIRHLHDTHAVEVRAGKGPHAGELYCMQCKKSIQWLSRQDYEFLLKENQ